jgi:hypothetical protein
MKRSIPKSLLPAMAALALAAEPSGASAADRAAV